MYIYGDGKWHEVEYVTKPGAMSIYITSCGKYYTGECKTSEILSIPDSRALCGKCLILHSGAERRT